MRDLAWICLGGALGGGARYLASAWLLRALGPAFPWGTLAVNVAGCFALGALLHLGPQVSLSPTARLALATGVLGGFTTFSTFAYETLRFLQQGAPGLAALHASAHLLAGLAACSLGASVARAL